MRLTRRLVLGGSASTLAARHAMGKLFNSVGGGAPAAGGGGGGAFIVGQTFGSTTTGGNAANGLQGMVFTVGSSNLSVTALGRWVISGNSQMHTLTLYDVTTSAISGSGGPVSTGLSQVGSSVVLNAATATPG